MKSYLHDLIRLGMVIVTVIITFSICLWIWGAWNDEWSGYNASTRISDGYCNIAVIPIMGDITTLDYSIEQDELGATFPYTTADGAVALLRQAEYDPYIDGVLIRIDSYGGYPTASEIVANAVKNSPLPSVALIREAGTSGGYLVATGANTIIASPFSDVGGIGVTLSYVENWQQNAREGLSYVSLASAPFKDYLDPNKPLTVAERELIERDLNILHEQFAKEVFENRNLPLEDVMKIADGSSMPGQLALENGLIDSLGDQETARQWFADRLQVSPDEIAFCE